MKRRLRNLGRLALRVHDAIVCPCGRTFNAGRFPGNRLDHVAASAAWARHVIDGCTGKPSPQPAGRAE